MTGREKVIAAYICQNEKWPDKRCEKCPYGYEYLDQTGDNSFFTCNTERIMVDAIDLLIAQEPRVMTREEYDAWTDIPFTERDPVFHEERTERGSVTCWVNTTVCSSREYGKNDRCWTSRPTDEQMEAVKWE